MRKKMIMMIVRVMMVFKATAFNSRWGDTISIMLVVSSLCWIIAKITLICFRFTGNKTRMAAVKLIAPTWVSIDIPASPPPPWSMTATKRHKMYFYKTLFFPLCSCLIDGLEDRKIYYKVPKETQYRLNVKLWPTAWGCDLGGEERGTCFRLHDINVLLLLYLHCH